VATAPATGRALPASADAAAERTRALYERYSRQIFAYCLLQLRNREDAEDAVQSTFLNAFRGLERGVTPELESAWLHKIAQHVCLTRQRSWSRRRLVESPQDFDAAAALLGAPVRDTDAAAGLTDALRELPEPQRRAILLREWQGLTYKEIAEELDVSQAAVETLIFRARRALAQSLEKLRGTGDLGSLVAAFKSLLVGGGTKAAATLLTVATTSVVAATPAARQTVVHLVDAVARPDSPAPVKTERPVQRKAVPAAVTVPVIRHVVRPPRRVDPHRTARTLPAPVTPHATKQTILVPVPRRAVSAPAPEKPKSEHAAAVTTAAAVAAAPQPTEPAPTTTTAVVPKSAPPTPSSAPASVTSTLPGIGGFTPSSGPPGTIVQVTGKSLGGATSVRFNGTSADFTVTSDGQITTKVPSAATTGQLTIVTPSGTVTSDGSFTVTAAASTTTTTTSSTASPPPPPAPLVSGTSPASGTPGTIVQIAGSHLTGATAVRFNGTSADFTVVSDSQITAKVPAAATSGPLSVVTPQGTAASSGTFTVTTADPSIDGFTPRTGPVGSSVVLIGHGFTGTTAVGLNGTAAAFRVDSDTQLTFDVPAGATSGPVSVTTPNGTVTSSTSFTVGTPAPEISGFSPPSGAAGTSVGIGGAHFTGATAVKFNGVAAGFTVGSDGLITAIVPAAATSGAVTVTTAGGTATSAATFTVTH
jgi:RNA polymerase sigma factor (sigma-70 family)